MPNTPIGVGISIFAILAGLFLMAGGNFGMFIDPISILVVFVGPIGVTLASGTMRQFSNAMGAAGSIWGATAFPYAETIQQFKEMASVLRREGPMGLQAVDITDDLMQFGTELILGGVADSETLSAQMMPRLDAIKADAGSNQVVWVTIGSFAPAYGMIGTLIGLVAMLANLSDPSTLGPSMAVAMITTLYGTLVANLVAAPVANKIGCNTDEELVYKDMVVAGMIELLNAPDPDGMVDTMLSRVPLGLLEEVTPQVREAEAG